MQTFRRIGLLIMTLIPFGGQAQTGDCRMKWQDISPVIGRFNPFFTDHAWDDRTKSESARMDEFHVLTIRQKACIRHHILFSMLIDAAAVEEGPKYWITEATVMMKRIFFHDPSYALIKREFEKKFIRQFQGTGFNKMFSFPVGQQNFICRIDKGNWGGRIQIEMVTLLLKERIKTPGIAREKDDGWFEEENN